MVINISFENAVDLVEIEIAQQVRDISLRFFSFAAAFAEKRGIIIADTKFEFGILGGKLVLIDELFTPDSSVSGQPTRTDPAHRHLVSINIS